MIQRIEGSDTYTFTYDAENRLVAGLKNGVTLASYTYDGDGRDLCTPERSERGKRVKVVEGGLTTYYIGDYYEWREGSTTTAVKYYYAGGSRIAMRTSGTLTWLLGDHLGSATITATENGTLASEQKYTAWGQTRSGSVTTDRQYTPCGKTALRVQAGQISDNLSLGGTMITVGGTRIDAKEINMCPDEPTNKTSDTHIDQLHRPLAGLLRARQMWTRVRQPAPFRG